LIRVTIRIAIVLCTLAHAARAGSLEGEGQIGAAVANLPGLSAFALGARVATNPVGHVSLGLRGFLILGGGPDSSGTTSQFLGWAALAEIRVHTGDWLTPVRIHLGAAAGIGREVAAANPQSESNTFEATTTGLTLSPSLGVRVRLRSMFIGAEVAPFFWAGHETTGGSGFTNPNGGLGALLVLSCGFAG
jgi:hypothetical protein